MFGTVPTIMCWRHDITCMHENTICCVYREVTSW